MVNTTNKNISFKGEPLKVTGKELKIGDMLPDFVLTNTDMGDFKSESVKGKTIIFSVVPSLDTPTCALQTKRFNTEAAKLGDNVKIITVSMDLPFAQKRWCGTEGVENVIPLSDYKYRSIGEKFGTFIEAWGLLARAVFVADKTGKLIHVEYVQSISEEPDYDAALRAVA